MKIHGMMRVKNEARWIGRVINSLLPLCDHITVMDDSSTDGTADEARKYPEVTVLPSPFTGLDEVRDKNWLLAKALEHNPEWLACIDGDEVLELGGADKIREAIRAGIGRAFSLRILYLWNDDKHIRVDGVYGNFRRPSIFRNVGTLDFGQTSHGGNFHCSNVPRQLIPGFQPCGAALLHYGYMDVQDRLRKFAWYNQRDPNSYSEDCYRHMVQGDIPEVPADARLMYAGPLRLMEIA